MAENPDLQVAITGDASQAVAAFKELQAEEKLAQVTSYLFKLYVDAIQQRSFVVATQHARTMFFIENGTEGLDSPAEEFEDFEDRLHEDADAKILADHERDIANSLEY